MDSTRWSGSCFVTERLRSWEGISLAWHQYERVSSVSHVWKVVEGVVVPLDRVSRAVRRRVPLLAAVTTYFEAVDEAEEQRPRHVCCVSVCVSERKIEIEEMKEW